MSYSLHAMLCLPSLHIRFHVDTCDDCIWHHFTSITCTMYIWCKHSPLVVWSFNDSSFGYTHVRSENETTDRGLIFLFLVLGNHNSENVERRPPPLSLSVCVCVCVCVCVL